MAYDVTNNTSTIELGPGSSIPVPSNLTPIALPPITPTPELISVDAAAPVGTIVELPNTLPSPELIAPDNVSPVGTVVELPPDVPPDGIVYLETIPIPDEINIVESPLRLEQLQDVNIAPRNDQDFLQYDAASNTYIHVPAPTSGGDVFTADINVVLSGGKSFGKYTNGQTIPATGKTAVEVILDAAIEYIAATWSFFSVGVQPTTVEVGTIIAGGRTWTWGINLNSGNVPTISIEDVTSASAIVVDTPNDGSHIDVANTIQLNSDGATQQWRGIATDITPIPNVVFNSSPYTVTARFYRFYGASATSPTNSATVRALPQSAFQTGGNTFNLNTGSTLTKFVVALPPGRTITSVIDLDALNAVITSEYIAKPSINVLDAGGTNRAYNIYEMNVGAPYSSDHRHQINTA
jgi:hypothetical protein